MINNIPHLIRNKIPTLLVLSAAALALVLLSSPLLPLSNFILQPVQAQSNLSFQTPTPASGTVNVPYVAASITFDAQGETFVGPDKLGTNGTFQITSGSGQILYGGSVFRVQANSGFANVNNSGKPIIVFGDVTKPKPQGTIEISTSCSTSASNDISVMNIGDFTGPVECSASQGGDNTTTTTQQSSSPSMVAGSSQDGDGDGDGIPDSSDNCTHNSNPRCFKEGGDTSSTTQQQPSSNRTGNQTR
jgi:hypothetical protein